MVLLQVLKLENLNLFLHVQNVQYNQVQICFLTRDDLRTQCFIIHVLLDKKSNIFRCFGNLSMSTGMLKMRDMANIILLSEGNSPIWHQNGANAKLLAPLRY